MMMYTINQKNFTTTDHDAVSCFLLNLAKMPDKMLWWSDTREREIQL